MKTGDRVPFNQHMGFELMVFDAGLSELCFTARPEHLNAFGVAHGGALMALLDAAMAAAARSVQKDMGLVTIEMKTSFMQPAHGPLRAKGHLMHLTATLAFTEATVHDAQGRACAHATGTYKFVRGLATGTKGVKTLRQIPTD